MVEIGRAGVKAGNAPIEQKISAYPPSRNLRLYEYTPLGDDIRSPREASLKSYRAWTAIALSLGGSVAAAGKPAASR
jgi:hypothetical protein